MKTIYNSCVESPFYRHPLYMIADKIKRALCTNGFQLVDDGKIPEVELAETAYNTWEEPECDFDWLNDRISFQDGKTVFRTRLLPGLVEHMKKAGNISKDRIFSFGRVYHKQDTLKPMHSHIEGLYCLKAFTTDEEWYLWKNVGEELFGLGTEVWFVPVGEDSHKIVFKDIRGNKEYIIGYVGAASDQLIQEYGCGNESEWRVFVIDVDKYATEVLDLDNREELYCVDSKILEQYECNESSAGKTYANRVADVLRRLGYLEFVGETIHPDGIYKKMNMIQDSWDSNNNPYALDEPLGEATALRTVLTPSMEEALAVNYKKGNKEVYLFEIGHIYLPVKGESLPKEQLAVSIGAYGPDVTEESFAEDMGKILTNIGIIGEMLATTDQAIAYKKGTCKLLISSEFKYLDGNFGGISPIACENFGIGCEAFMAQIELAAPEAEAARIRRK